MEIFFQNRLYYALLGDLYFVTAFFKLTFRIQENIPHPTSHIPNIPHPEHPTSWTSHILNIPHPKHSTSPTSHITNIPHPKHPTSWTSHILNMPHPKHSTYRPPKFLISHIPNMPHPDNPTSWTFQIWNMPNLKHRHISTSPTSQYAFSLAYHILNITHLVRQII